MPNEAFSLNGSCMYTSCMSGDWHLVRWYVPPHSMFIDPIDDWNMIFQDNDSMQGSMFVCIVAGSNKTTVSITSGSQEYHPVYMHPSTA
jgi:hypothetical protein